MMLAVRRDLPSGTVTFLFTDVEGSTKLLNELGAPAYAGALAEHRRVIRRAYTTCAGVEVDAQGDAFFLAFSTASAARDAARSIIEGLESGQIRVRMGLHTGTPLLADEGYVGGDVHRAARIAACGHGGQVLISGSTASLLGTDGLRDLGEHRLKDLSAPERIFQLGDHEFPPLRSLHQTNLPIPSTPFLGRANELAEVLALLSRGDVRLLTLTGPGGTGKTRLALKAAAELAGRYPHGVWWVPLAALRDPKLVLETAGRALGAKKGVADHIADRSMLLVFDNFEQLIEAAADFAALLSRCPSLDLLVTSREPLHVTGEQEYPVPPLVHDEGVNFFIARARAVRPDFQADDAVSEICRRLDDLPLALELAAARVRALSSRQIVARLDRRLPLLTGGPRDVPERHRTLRATIEWSYALLKPAEQRLFADLAVFSGGCTLEAAEVIAGANLDTLASLVDKSLLRHTDDRFRMLELIREYAGERLEESGEALQLGMRHAEYFLALAEEADPYLRGNPKEWLDLLDAEQDNFRAALDRLERSGLTQPALSLAGALTRFWYMRGHLAEARRRLDAALRADRRPTAARARALNGAAMMVANGGDLAIGKLRAEEALALHRTLGDQAGAAYSVFMLAMLATEEADWATAQPLFEESLRAFRELGDEHYALLATDGLAWTYGELGDAERRRAMHEDVLRRARTQSDELVAAIQLDQLARFALDEGRVPDALGMLRESLRIYRDLDRPGGIVEDLCRFAEIFAVEGRAERATLLLSRADALCKEIGGAPLWVAELNDKTLATVRTQLDHAALAEAWEHGRALTLDEAIALALES